ncbi:MAG: hypothetical protein JXQ83_00220 [Candidatus Glassbacteria bacterium]|nr:hypothetical protein [Candidatus Glassbacteria bacterium]
MRANTGWIRWLTVLSAAAVFWTAGCRTGPGSAEHNSLSAGAEKEPAHSWRVIGPGGGGGIFLPTISPFDPDLVLTHCDMTAAYITYDGGGSWRMFNLWNVPSDFEFDPGDPETIYAACRGYLHSEDRGSGLSLLFRSEDRGKRWRVIYPDIARAVPVEKLQSRDFLPSGIIEGALDATIQKIRVDPADSRRIFLGLSPLRAYMGSGDRQEVKSAMLVVSADRGATWRLVAELPGFVPLAIFPGSPAGHPDEVTVFTERACARVELSSGKLTQVSLPVERIAAVEGGTGAQGTTIYLLAPMGRREGKLEGGVFRSTDRGASWTQASGGLLQGVAEGQVPRIRTMAVCRSRPEVAYLSSYNSAGEQGGWRYGIFKTANAGESWEPVLLSDNRGYLTGNYTGGWMERSYDPGWGGNPLALGVAPGDPEICYATDAGRACRTIDGGKTWRQVYSRDLADGSAATIGLNVTTCYGVHFDPFDRDHFFITYTDIGLFHTFNGGESWLHSLEGVPEPWVNTCYWLEFDPQVKGRLWSVWANAHDLPRDKMFGRQGFGRYQGGVAVSEDGGRTWRRSGEGIPENSVGTHLLIDPESPAGSRTLYACIFDRGVYKSVDGGNSWQEANRGLGDNRYAWKVRRNSRGRLFLLLSRGRREGGTVDGELYSSDDRAGSWQPVPLPQGVNAPHDLVIDPAEPDRMYLCCWTRTLEGEDRHGGVFRTEDGGRTWKRVFDERIRVNSGALDPEQPGTIFINTFQNAAYRSDDRGETWKRLEGYRFKWGQRAVPDVNNPGMLFLTTYGGSVFYGPAAGVPGAFEDIGNLPETWW